MKRMAKVLALLAIGCVAPAGAASAQTAPPLLQAAAPKFCFAAASGCPATKLVICFAAVDQSAGRPCAKTKPEFRVTSGARDIALSRAAASTAKTPGRTAVYR
jgi:hypothetical protein